MTQNPILKVLSTLKKYNVKSLLIGGQACIIYGAAEFSRDSDFVVLCSPENIKHLKEALNTLRAELIYVPPLEVEYLERGHACHFRCKARDVENLRIDVISKLRGCEPFGRLWQRKNIVSVKGGSVIDIIGLEDLVQSKKTQRDKDWYMLKRLVENDIIAHKKNSSTQHLKWWFGECRIAEALIELAKEYPEVAKECLIKRPLISLAMASNAQKLKLELYEEEIGERQRDVEYWIPLRKELENLRHNLLSQH